MPLLQFTATVGYAALFGVASFVLGVVVLDAMWAHGSLIETDGWRAMLAYTAVMGMILAVPSGLAAGFGWSRTALVLGPVAFCWIEIGTWLGIVQRSVDTSPSTALNLTVAAPRAPASGS
jgi:hypothetical protein